MAVRLFKHIFLKTLLKKNLADMPFLYLGGDGFLTACISKPLDKKK
jgi:hypothetical protein